MSAPSIVVEARRDESDIKSAYWLLFWRRKTWMWLLLGSAAFGLSASPGHGVAEASAVAAAAFVALLMFATAWIMDRGERLGPLALRFDPTTYRFSTASLDVEVDGVGVGTWSWSAFEQAFDNDRVLVLMRRASPPLLIPKRQIGDAWPRLRALLDLVLNDRAAFQPEQR